MSRWKQQIEEYDSLFRQILQKKENNQGDLRFNRSSIRASDVAGQYFCEKKIEMQYHYGEIETKTKTHGTEAHENLLEGSEAVDREGRAP